MADPVIDTLRAPRAGAAAPIPVLADTPGWREWAGSVLRGSPMLKVLGLLISLGAWQVYAVSSGNRMIPGLELIVEKFVELLSDGELIEHTTTTLARGFAGLGISFVVAGGLGFVAARNGVVDAALGPFVSLGYPVPKLALYPIVILLLGLGGGSKIAQVALECFFPIFVHCYAGARAVSSKMEWLGRNVGAGRWCFFKDVIVPTALPFIFTGLRVAVPIMLIVMTVTEFIGDSQGLGYLIARSASYFDSASAFAVVATLGAIGFVSDRLIVKLRSRIVFWEKGASL